MGDGALGSDHINYLILRYLQESGHENAAKALLSQDWSRPDEYRDPEKLPFAPKVKQYDLVNIIQDGLFHDQLQAQVTKQPQRFDLIAVHSTTLNTNTNTTTTSSTADPDTVSASRSAQKHPHPQSQQPQQSQQNCYSHSQPSRRRSTPPPRPTGTAAAAAAAADHDDFPLPASKRARKTTENDDDDDNDDDHDHDHAHAHAHARGPSNHVNGDAMDLDLNALPSADDVRSDQDNPTDNDRTMSDHPDTAHSTSSPPPRPPVVETSSAATQTDKKIKPLNSETLYWSIDADGASIMHAIWNPNPDMAARLLTVGESLCRFHTLPDQHPQSLDTTNGDTDKIKHAQHAHHVDVEAMPRGSITTAACWHPTGRYATCALEIPRSLNGATPPIRSMFDTEGRIAQGGKRYYSDHAYAQILQRQNPTVTMALRYSQDGSYLLSVSTNMKRALVEIWQGPSEEPLAFKMFPDPVLDAVWASNSEIIVCGKDCLQLYTVLTAPASRDTLMTNGDSDSSTSPGLRNLSLTYSHDTDKHWEKVRFDSVHRVIVALAPQNDSFIVLGPSDPDQGSLAWAPLLESSAAASFSPITAIAFEPINPALDSSSPRRLATTHQSGAVTVYAVTSTSCTKLHQLRIGLPGVEAALALSWSPDGKYLAVASDEAVKIWQATPSGMSPSSSPVLSWKASPEHWGNSTFSPANGTGTTSNPDHMLVAENGAASVATDGDGQEIYEPALAWDATCNRLVFALGKKIAVIRLLE